MRCAIDNDIGSHLVKTCEHLLRRGDLQLAAIYGDDVAPRQRVCKGAPEQAPRPRQKHPHGGGCVRHAHPRSAANAS